ncbi:RluA family pseudouridine synthase [bacterium]|nr:RluA family pseudouridine synthase [bacterium]
MVDGVNNMEILYEDNHILVVVKPTYVLSQSDGSDTPDMLTILKKYLKEKYNKPGNVYLGLVHRLDKEVGGVMVFAKTSKAASRLSEQVRLHQFEKYYLAVVKGKVESNTYKDKILREEYQSKIDEKGKEAILSFETLKVIDNNSLVKIKLLTGRHHQIRVQFKARGHYLLGDKRYGKKGEFPLALYAYHLAFYHPITKEKLIFENIPNTGYFSKFNVKELLKNKS